MIYDCFLFCGELDLLEIRLNLLAPYVDRFILVEAEKTFSGLPKSLCYLDNKERFKQWEHKIIHHIVKETQELTKMAWDSPNTGNKEHWWLREFIHKENVMLPLVNCKDDDIIYVSDVDEIWNPDVKFKIDNDKVYKFKQTAYHYFLNNQSDQDIKGWVGTHCGTYKTLKKYGANHFRTEREVKSILIENGGWHFTFMGGAEAIKKKVESYGHQEYNNDYVKENIQSCIDKNVDFLDRGFKLWVSEENLPQYLKDNKDKYVKYFL